jgi:hypothetical protein
MTISTLTIGQYSVFYIRSFRVIFVPGNCRSVKLARRFGGSLDTRIVFRVALGYIIAGWLTMQVIDVMFPALRLPEWLTSAVAAFVITSFPFTLIFNEAKRDPHWQEYRASFSL